MKSFSKLLLKPKFPPNSLKVTGPKSGPTVFPKLSLTGLKPSAGGRGRGRWPDWRDGCWRGGEGAGGGPGGLLGWCDGNWIMVGPGTKGRGFRMLSGAGTSEELKGAS